MGDTTDRKKARLLRHDRMIVTNELRSAFTSRSDRLIALAVLLIVLVAVRSALSHRPFIFAAAAVTSLATAVGAWVARIIERRVDFHSQYGVLAADAFADDARWHYAVPVHALVSAVVTVCAAIGRPATIVLAPIGYLLGAGICHVAYRVALTNASTRRTSALRAFRRLLQRPVSGAFAGILAVLPLVLLRAIEPVPMAAFIGFVSVVAALLLTMLDYNVVRFMTESGYSAGRIIGIHVRSTLVFLFLTVIAALVLSERVVAIVVAGVVLAALTFMTSRILAYRIHSKRTADTLVSICAGITCVSGVATPALIPFVVIAILWQLHRRALPATWLLT